MQAYTQTLISSNGFPDPSAIVPSGLTTLPANTVCSEMCAVTSRLIKHARGYCNISREIASESKVVASVQKSRKWSDESVYPCQKAWMVRHLCIYLCMFV